MNNIKAIIFDLNGVFVVSEFLSARLERDFRVVEEDFLPALSEVMATVRMPGAGNVYSYWVPYLKKWGVEMSEQEFLSYWFGGEKESPEMVALARELKEKGVKLFILSNNFRERAAYYKGNFYFLDELFEKVYYSWQTGFVKPDERAFKIVLEENNLSPEECVFFDDSVKNVEVGNSLGIKSFLFKDAKDTREKLLELRI